MVEIVEHSNLLDVKSGIICHQVNCIGAMGAGLALQIRNKWPVVYKKYQDDCKQFMTHPDKMLGHVLDVMVEPDLIVANCFGQVFPSHIGKQTDYEAWDIMLNKVQDLGTYFSLDIHFPYMIGCGLAGGDWNVMSEKIERLFGKSQTRAFIHKL
jgi:O-acetyl-ADP-ribose deacetylase (regulator of RNase III)